MRAKLVAGNWKMNGNLASNQALLETVIPALAPLKRANYAVCVPFPYLAQALHALRGSNVALGAQDVCQFDEGAYTGGVSAAMLADFGCRYVIVGHSERRNVFGETDDIVALKFAAAVKHRLTPILCVGETLAEREFDLLITGFEDIEGSVELRDRKLLAFREEQLDVLELGHALLALRRDELHEHHGEDREVNAELLVTAARKLLDDLVVAELLPRLLEDPA